MDNSFASSVKKTVLGNLNKIREELTICRREIELLTTERDELQKKLFSTDSTLRQKIDMLLTQKGELEETLVETKSRLIAQLNQLTSHKKILEEKLT
ncbi:MAG: hypothetical protein HQM10_25590, partial [Candidatus Riflebacteria bacterium]|nr:hypothetical protein [Candidatus Riflebacteria bacterium]